MTGDPDLPRPDAASRSALTYYGELVRRQWQGCLPDVYQQIRDPGAFFVVLSEVIAQRIDELADYLAGDDPPGEGYLAKVARLTAGVIVKTCGSRSFRRLRRSLLGCCW